MTTPKKKRDKWPQDEHHDRFSLSVRKGFSAWLRKAADELNLDRSKLARQAIEDFVKSNRHKLSPELLKQFDELKKASGRYDELL